MSPHHSDQIKHKKGFILPKKYRALPRILRPERPKGAKDEVTARIILELIHVVPPVILEMTQVTDSISGSVVPLAMFIKHP